MAQFITFDKSGRLGVNFGGYHAGIGAGSGGLFAEAGTPTGQNARAGLGGAAEKDGRAQGGLYAEANAGGGIGARAGLGGRTEAEGASGGAFAHSSAGGKHAGAGIGGETSDSGSTGFKYATKTKTKVVTVDEGEVAPPVEVSPPFEIPPPVKIPQKKPHVEYSVRKDINVQTDIKSPESNAVEYDNVNLLSQRSEPAEPQPLPPREEPVVVYKKVRKPHLHNTRIYKTPVVVATDRVDVPYHPAPVGGEVVYTKTIQAHRSPTFFADIFNIPISTLGAVSKFLGNAASTNIAVEKKIHANAGTDEQLKSGSVESSVTVHADKPVSSFIDGVFSIPINTLQAVNKFLENNVPARKQVVVTSTGETAVAPPPHVGRAARRALRRGGGYTKTVVVEQEQPQVEEH